MKTKSYFIMFMRKISLYNTIKLLEVSSRKYIERGKSKEREKQIKINKKWGIGCFSL